MGWVELHVSVINTWIGAATPEFCRFCNGRIECPLEDKKHIPTNLLNVWNQLRSTGSATNNDSTNQYLSA